jgi:hypothetical protein
VSERGLCRKIARVFAPCFSILDNTGGDDPRKNIPPQDFSSPRCAVTRCAPQAVFLENYCTRRRGKTDSSDVRGRYSRRAKAVPSSRSMVAHHHPCFSERNVHIRRRCTIDGACWQGPDMGHARSPGDRYSQPLAGERDTRFLCVLQVWCRLSCTES